MASTCRCISLQSWKAAGYMVLLRGQEVTHSRFPHYYQGTQDSRATCCLVNHGRRAMEYCDHSRHTVFMALRWRSAWSLGMCLTCLGANQAHLV